jgi:hypothetical protein
MGSSLVSQPGFLGSGKIAASVANLFGGSSTALGGLFAGKFGSAIVLGAMVAWGGVIAAAGLKISGKLGGLSTASSARSVASYSPGGLDGSGIVIDRPKNRSLGYLANANQGEIVWDKEHSMAPKAEEPKEEVVDAPEGDADQMPQFEMPDVSALMEENKDGKGLDRESFVRKLSKDTGGGNGKRLANGLAGFNMKQPKLSQPALKPRGAKTGSTSALARARSKLSARSMSTSRGSANKAMGQLKLSRFMSKQGTSAQGDSQQRGYSADAFDQSQAIGGELDGVGEGSGIVVPPGNGAPGTGLGAGANDLAPPPSAGPGHNVTPYQGNVDRARNMDNQAGQNKMMSIMLIALGIALIVAGATKMPSPLGAILIAIGIAMVGMGMMMMMMAQNQAGAAKNEANQIEDRYGQGDQSNVIDDCADQAAGSGTNADACAPSTTPAQIKKEIEADTSHIKRAVQEQQDATYELDGGGQGAEQTAPAQ